MDYGHEDIGSDRKSFDFDYKRIAIFEVVIIMIISFSTLYLTILALSSPIGFAEGNPLSVFIFSRYGYYLSAVINVIYPILLYYVVETIGKWVELPWFSVLVLTLVIVILLFDLVHDIVLTSTYGVI